MRDYKTFSDHVLLQQYKRLSSKILNITLKKVQLVIQEYNEQRLDLANILIQLKKRGHVQKMPQGTVNIEIGTSKDEDSRKGK